MNRRSFFKNLAIGAATFSILPAATTYERIWKKASSGLYVLNPLWVNAPLEVRLILNPKIPSVQFGGIVMDRRSVPENSDLGDGFRVVQYAYPIRGYHTDITGNITDPVPPFIEQHELISI